MAKPKKPPAAPPPPSDETRKKISEMFRADLDEVYALSKRLFGDDVSTGIVFELFDRVDLSEPPSTWGAIADRFDNVRKLCDGLLGADEHGLLFDVYDRLYLEDGRILPGTDDDLTEAVRLAKASFGPQATVSAVLDIFDRLFVEEE
jgi:hypothetical protein